MEQIKQGLNWLIGLELESKDLNAGHMSLRAALVFAVAIIMLRIGDKRFMGKSTALDVMLGIVFGSTVSRAITGNAPFFPTLAACIVLVFVHWLLASITFRSEGFAALVKGRDRLLVQDSEMRREAMRKSHITENDLEEALRNSGKPPDLSQVRTAHLKRNGDISIISKD